MTVRTSLPLKAGVAWLVACAGFAMPCAEGLAQDAPKIDVANLAAPPKVDGDLAEWGADGWVTVKVEPAVKGDKKNTTGVRDVQIKAGLSGGRLYFAARWPDPSEDRQARTWQWRLNKYNMGKEHDDMFAVRFHMDGNYDACMIVEKTYKVDVWLWSAGRSDPAGKAEDMTHLITTDMLENAAEYENPSGKITYIRKLDDAGDPPYSTSGPADRRKNEGDQLPGYVISGPATGSAANVDAKGVWKDGFWTLELARDLATNQPDDVTFTPGKGVLGQIAVFDQGYLEHKSVSVPLVFQLAP